MDTAVYAQTGDVPDPAQDPSDNVDGCYYNYPDVDLNDFGGLENALRLYFLDNLPRLLQTKRTWGPQNIFHGQQSFPVT